MKKKVVKKVVLKEKELVKISGGTTLSCGFGIMRLIFGKKKH